MESGDRSWSEGDSDDFRAFGDVFVPARDLQTRIIVDLVPATAEPFDVVELGCGEGWLGAAILERYPSSRLLAVDASSTMLAALDDRLGGRFGGRVRTLSRRIEELIDEPPGRVRCFVSSLAIHHLEHGDKRRLFGTIAASLEPGGAFLMADVVLPACDAVHRQAARLWDEEAERRAGERGAHAALERFRRDGWNMYALERIDPEDRPARLIDQIDWLRDAGFATVDVPWVLAGHAIVAARIDGPDADA